MQSLPKKKLGKTPRNAELLVFCIIAIQYVVLFRVLSLLMRPTMFETTQQLFEKRSSYYAANHYYRVDEVGPNVVESKNFYFHTIPTNLRYRGLEKWREESREYNKTEPAYHYYFEFNPSFIHLPPPQIPNFLDNTSRYYLGAFRLSVQQACLPDTLNGEKVGSKPLAGRNYDYLGLAVMDLSFRMITETIISVHDRDWRLHVLDNQIYLTYSSMLSKLYINPPPDKKVHEMKTLFPTTNNKSTVTFFGGYERYCCTSHLCQGKNFNYFQIGDKTYVDTRSMNPHIVEEVDLLTPRKCYDKDWKVFIQPVTEFNHSSDSNTSLYITETTPKPNFRSIDEELLEKFNLTDTSILSDNRGTSCCVRIANPQSSSTSGYLLLGISHTKVSQWYELMVPREYKGNISFTSRQYLNRFYAFEPYPPFRVVAQSGPFCMPWPSEGDPIPSLDAIKSSPAYRVNVDMNCPFITFTHGILESIDDPSKVIISYGVNDCGATMVNVYKDEISRMLFG